MFSRAAVTTHICPMCYKQFSEPSDVEFTCDFCDSELMTMSFPEPVEKFFRKRTPNHLRAQLVTQDEKIRAAIVKKQNTFYLKDFRKSIKAVLKLAKQLGYDD